MNPVSCHLFENYPFFFSTIVMLNACILFFASSQGTGNVVLDMEQQMQANSIRIKVLEQENSTLHSSLEKLRERIQHNATRVGLMEML